MKIAYIVSMFPKLSETFILRELVELDKTGVELTVFSIKGCAEKVIHDDAYKFTQRTVYIPPKKWHCIIVQHLRLMATKPVIYFSAIKKLMKWRDVNSRVRMKSLWVFLIAPYFCFQAQKRGVGYLHAHFATYPALLAWLIHEFIGIPFSVTAHAHDIYMNQDILRLIAEEASTLFTISEYNRKFITDKLAPYISIEPEKIQVNRCGIDLVRYKFNPDRPFRGSDRRCKRIVSIGRLCEMKGFRYLLDALALLRSDGFEFVCDIIGDGPLMSQLVKHSEALGLSSQVSFLGSKNSTEVLEHLNNADIFVLASVVTENEGYDGIPVVFMEAMALGVPVIGTRISGIPELIIHEKTGLVAEPEDPVSLKDNIARQLNEERETRARVLRARRLIEEEYAIVKTANAVKQCGERCGIHIDLLMSPG